MINFMKTIKCEHTVKYHERRQSKNVHQYSLGWAIWQLTLTNAPLNFSVYMLL